MSDKRVVLEAIRRMPDTANLDDIRNELALLASLRRAEEDIKAGRFIPHAEVVKRSAQWTSN
jgi:predicted transcriptional regulator